MHPWLWWHCCSCWTQRYHIACANSNAVSTDCVAEAATISHPSIIATHWIVGIEGLIIVSINADRNSVALGLFCHPLHLKSPKLSARKREFKDFFEFFWNFWIFGLQRHLLLIEACRWCGEVIVNWGCIRGWWHPSCRLWLHPLFCPSAIWPPQVHSKYCVACSSFALQRCKPQDNNEQQKHVKILARSLHWQWHSVPSKRESLLSFLYLQSCLELLLLLAEWQGCAEQGKGLGGGLRVLWQQWRLEQWKSERTELWYRAGRIGWRFVEWSMECGRRVAGGARSSEIRQWELCSTMWMLASPLSTWPIIVSHHHSCLYLFFLCPSLLHFSSSQEICRRKRMFSLFWGWPNRHC